MTGCVVLKVEKRLINFPVSLMTMNDIQVFTAAACQIFLSMLAAPLLDTSL